VTVAFSSPKLGMPRIAVQPARRSADTYCVTGIYTPVVGPWNVAVTTPGGRTTSFDLGITAAQPELPDPPPVLVGSSTWRWGIGEVIVVVGILGGAWFASTRRTRRGRGTLEAATQSA
jgi:hypothetical protein